MIAYGKQDIQFDDIEFVVDVLKSDFLKQGPIVPKFEEAISVLAEAKYVTAVNSATSALHIACLALELKPGDYGLSQILSLHLLIVLYTVARK